MKLEVAYKKMLNGENAHKCVRTQSLLWSARAQVKRGELPSDRLMRERLKLAGWRLDREEDWKEVL